VRPRRDYSSMTDDGTTSAAAMGTTPGDPNARVTPIVIVAVAGAAILVVVVVAMTAAGGSAAAMAGHNPWLPTALRISAVLIYTGVVVVHGWHLRVTSARERLWHAIHVLMALGMIVMFAPMRRLVVVAGVGKWVFAVAAAGIVAYVAVLLVRGERLGWLWLAAAADLAAMAYMFAMPTPGLQWLTWLLVAWSTLQAIGWLTGVLPQRADLGSPAVSAAACPRQDLSISVTLAVMNFGMAYMFVAMAVGTAAMGGMGGMRGM